MSIFSNPGTQKIERQGHTWIRNLGKVCPQCGQMFYGYQVEGHEHEPYRVDPEPMGGFGVRETCGDAQCWDAEDERQFRARVEWRKTRGNRT